MLYRAYMTGGHLVREARLRAGLTQRQLGAAAGVSQPSIARIEAGTTGATVAQVQRLVEACGLELRIWLVARDDSDWSVAQANLRLDPDARVRQHQAALHFIRAGREARPISDARGDRQTRTAGQPRTLRRSHTRSGP
jgi:hypothetical protein